MDVRKKKITLIIRGRLPIGACVLLVEQLK